MSFRNRTGLLGLLIGSSLAIASACGGLSDVKIIISDDAGGSGGHPGGGNGSSGKPNGGETSAESGAGGVIDVPGAGAGGAAGDGGSGGEGGAYVAPDPMPGPPTVTSVAPKDQANDADPRGAIRIYFSEPLDPASVTAANIQIKDAAGTVVEGPVNYADGIVTLLPKGRMALLGNYTVNVSTGVTDAGKTPMERPFTSSFSVRDGVWGRAESSLPSSSAAFDRLSPMVLAGDGAGRAVAVWAQVTGAATNYDIYASQFVLGKGWATPAKVSTNATNCQYPSVSMNANGNVIVGWIEYDSAAAAQPYSVQVRRYVANTWDPMPTRVDVASSSAYVLNVENVAVSINANGHAHVAWDAWDYNSGANPAVNDYGMYVRHVDAMGTWDASVTTLSYLQVGSGISAPSLAFDGDSNGFAAYQFLSGSPLKVNTYVWRYVATTNKWGTSAVSSTAADGYPMPVAVATNPAGDAVLAWARATPADASNTNYDLMGSSYNKAWNTPVVISTARTAFSSATKWLASASWTGKSFLVAWGQSGGSTVHIYANEYKAAAWAAMPTIVSDGNHSSSLPWLTADGRGNALAVWAQQSDAASTATVVPTYIVSARFGSAGWKEPVRASSAFGGYRYPQAVTFADGSAVATWQRTIRPTIKSTSVDAIFQNDFQ
jgi:hypothetical protein